ncbi:hypothetical protein [Larkinella humicola]|uniref:Uncharacterized protein n=1 Tax=Larkinella humicola TaxID=2607654 RepID=A0A5N1JCU2_9BACT|nr:hypothetical protein [Larkinella humicola]KAA9353129.1 hypothetical protein F0P93_18345 [Larkinella humicola]
MKTTTAQNILLILLAFLGLGALGGGLTFILSPDGTLMGMPVSDQSPFRSFLVPGIILFVVLGMVPVGLVFALLKKPTFDGAELLNFYPDMHWSWTYSLYVAFALISWIQVQMVIIQAVHWLHTFYMFYAVAILFVALLPAVRNLYQRKSATDAV